MKLIVLVCVVVAAAVGLVVEAEVTPREVPNSRRYMASPRLPEESLRRVENRDLSLDSRARLHRPPPHQNAKIHDDTSQAASSRPVERPALVVPSTHYLSGFSWNPNTPRELSPARERLQTPNLSEEQRHNKPDQCCGSRVLVNPRTATRTGAFQRVTSAGSLKVVQVPNPNSYPPVEVRDLRAMPLDPHTLSLTWTAPGEDLDYGTASGYIIRLSETREHLQESQFDAAPEATLLETSDTLTTAGVYQPAGTRVGVEVPLVHQLMRGHVYYVAFKALDKDGLSSGVSNVVRVIIPEPSTVTNTAATHHMTTPNHAGHNTQAEESSGAGNSRGSVSRSRETAVFPERSPAPPPPSQRPSTASDQRTALRSRTSGEQSLLPTPPASISDPTEPQGSENRRKPRKDRKKKKNKKSKRRRNGGRRNGRKSNKQRKNSDTSVLSSLMFDINAELDKWKES